MYAVFCPINTSESLAEKSTTWSMSTGSLTTLMPELSAAATAVVSGSASAFSKASMRELSAGSVAGIESLPVSELSATRSDGRSLMSRLRSRHMALRMESMRGVEMVMRREGTVSTTSSATDVLSASEGVVEDCACGRAKTAVDRHKANAMYIYICFKAYSLGNIRCKITQKAWNNRYFCRFYAMKR